MVTTRQRGATSNGSSQLAQSPKLEPVFADANMRPSTPLRFLRALRGILFVMPAPFPRRRLAGNV